MRPSFSGLFCASLASLLFVSPSPSRAEGEITSTALRVDWRPGKAYILDTKTEVKTKAGEGNQMLTLNQRTELEVTPDAKGGKSVQVSFAHIEGKLEGPGGSAVFDTDKPAESDKDLLATLGQGLGKRFVLRYDAKNRFVESKAVDGLAATTDGPVLTTLSDVKTAGNLFRKSMEMGLPPGPVKLGDVWNGDEVITFPKAGETQVELSGKYVGEENFQEHKHAKISFDGKMKTTPKGKAKLPAQFSISDNSTLSGLVYYDLEQRVVTMSVSTAKLELNIDGEKMDFEQKVTTKLAGVQDVRRAIPLEDDATSNKE